MTSNDIAECAAGPLTVAVQIASPALHLADASCRAYESF